MGTETQTWHRDRKLSKNRNKIKPNMETQRLKEYCKPNWNQEQKTKYRYSRIWNQNTRTIKPIKIEKKSPKTQNHDKGFYMMHKDSL